MTVTSIATQEAMDEDPFEWFSLEALKDVSALLTAKQLRLLHMRINEEEVEAIADELNMTPADVVGEENEIRRMISGHMQEMAYELLRQEASLVAALSVALPEDLQQEIDGLLSQKKNG